MQNRRTFVKTSGLALAALPFLSRCGASESQKSMGLQVYTLRNQLGEDLEGTLEKAAKIGYTKIEVYDYKKGKFFGKNVREFKSILANVGLEVIGSHYYNGRHFPDRIGTMQKGWSQAIEDAAEIGISYMTCGYIHPEEQTSMELYYELFEILNKAAEETKQNGIQFCYHNHDFEFDTFDGKVPYFEMLDQLDSELIKMELDHYWVAKAGLSSVDLFNKYPGRFPLWHVKDMAEDGDFTEVGTGTIDYSAIFASAEQAGLKHFFVEQDEASIDRFESIKISYNNALKFA